MCEIHVVFDGPPGPESGRFVEVEDSEGRSINAGEWRKRDDGLWEIVFVTALAAGPVSAPSPRYDRATVEVTELLRTADGRLSELIARPSEAHDTGIFVQRQIRAAIRSILPAAPQPSDPTMPPGVVPGPTGAASSCGTSGTSEEDSGEGDDPACDAAYAKHCAEEEVERVHRAMNEARWAANEQSRRCSKPWTADEIELAQVRAAIAAMKEAGR